MTNRENITRNGGTYEDLIATFEANNFNTATIYGLPHDDEQIFDICESYGSQDICSILSGGYAKFNNPQQTCKFVADWHGKNYKGRPLIVEGCYLEDPFHHMMTEMAEAVASVGLQFDVVKYKRRVK